MAAELVNAATSDKLDEMDWNKNIQICELVARDPRAAKDAIRAIKKKLGGKSPTSQLHAIALLELLMNNIGEYIHKQVIESGILPILVKIVRTKTDFSIQERIFHLLDATQSSLGGASGNFPQYFSAYQELMSLGLQFPQQHQSAPSDPSVIQVNGSAPSASPLQEEKNIMPSREEASAKGDRLLHLSEVQCVSESSIIQKARNALEVLEEVMNTVDGQQTQHPLGAKDEFTLDLVEQCSFQKQRVMHLVLTSKNEKVVSQATELNEQLQKVLERHDALLSARRTTAHRVDCKPEEEEEARQLFRRIRRGKAFGRPENEENSNQRHTPELSESSNSDQSTVQGIVHETSTPTRKANMNNVPDQEVAFASGNGLSQQPEVQCIPESSIIHKAGSALEVLREVLDNADGQQARHPLGTKDEFTLDLVEQCSFQKQRVMHLVLTSRDEKTVSQAIELNEQLQNLLDRYDALLSGRTGMAASNVDCEADEEEEPQQLVRRIRKGKTRLRPEDEESSMRSFTPDLLEQSNSRQQVHHPLKQLACTELSESNGQLLPVAIPPPPSKHVEREIFFKRNKLAGSAVAGHMRFLSLQNIDGGSSHGGNSNCSD